MVHGWRIALPNYSHNHKEMLSGEGAFLFGGRWNSKGVRVAYLGSSLALAAMELLVHLNRVDMLKNFQVTKVSFDETLMEYIDFNDLPKDWKTPVMRPSIQAVGDDWVAAGSSLILQVPSIAVDGDYNYLLNPFHPNFDLLVLNPITSFQFDPRLLK